MHLPRHDLSKKPPAFLKITHPHYTEAERWRERGESLTGLPFSFSPASFRARS
jgi:hypothetical protein